MPVKVQPLHENSKVSECRDIYISTHPRWWSAIFKKAETYAFRGNGIFCFKSDF